jgi:uncharacterized protein YidB (DUF937 family)
MLCATTMTKRHRTKAGEAVERLRRDPDYIANMAMRNRELATHHAAERKELGELIDELRQAGLLIDDVWDLVNRPNNYDFAVPILLRHLGKDYCDRNLEGIGRAVAIPSSRAHWTEIVKRYKEIDEVHFMGAKQGLAVAVAKAVTRETLGELIELLRDERHGNSRLLVLDGLKRFRGAEVSAVLQELSQDPLFAHSLGRRKPR